MGFRRLSRALSVAGAVLGTATLAMAANLTVNGDFEDLVDPETAWTEFSSGGFDLIDDWTGASAGHRPGNSALLGQYGDASDSISQAVLTVLGIPTVLSFDLTRFTVGEVGADLLTVTFGGTTVATIDIGDGAASGLSDSTHAYDVTALMDGTVKSLTFTVTTNSFNDAGAFVDNIALSPVPEPTGVAAIALGALAMLRRKRR